MIGIADYALTDPAQNVNYLMRTYHSYCRYRK